VTDVIFSLSRFAKIGIFHVYESVLPPHNLFHPIYTVLQVAKSFSSLGLEHGLARVECFLVLGHECSHQRQFVLGWIRAIPPN
jgi:hypothetical protein